LKRKSVPVHQNLLTKDQISAKEISRSDLNLMLCKECGFIFNNAFELSKLSYGEDYDNSQLFSPYFREYTERLAKYLIYERDIKNCRIVEIGCGKGIFLRSLVEAEDAGNSGFGFDPSYIGPTSDLGGRLKFEKNYYGPEYADISADVVIGRHVIEHVPDPLGLLRTIGQALAKSPNARVFFETPCVEWILRNQVIWDFFYEHCSYFTAESLTTAFEASGFKVDRVQDVFQKQYLWLEAIISTEKLEVTKNPGSILYLAQQFAVSENNLKRDLLTRLREIAAKGKIAVWGAGAKGVTFANLIDPECRLIDCLVDLNPNKQEHYVPGTGHPILSYEELANRGVKTVILMNPNYHEENQALLREAGLDNINLIELRFGKT
jgi:SAM-dependent methyltransferase